MNTRPRDGDLPDEVWVPIAGHELDYAVSNMGRVKRTSRPRSGPTYPGKVLACRPNRFGYRCVVLRKDGENYWRTVHKLVCLAFLGPKPPGKEINHLDGDKLNSRLDNLEYCTSQANSLHRARVLKKCVGSENGGSKLTEADIPQIRARLAAGESQQSIANDYHVSQETVSRIHLRRNWAHI